MVATIGGSIQVLGQRWGGDGVNYDFQIFLFIYYDQFLLLTGDFQWLISG